MTNRKEEGFARDTFISNNPESSDWLAMMEEEKGVLQSYIGLVMTDERSIGVFRFEKGYRLEFFNPKYKDDEDKGYTIINLTPEAMCAFGNLYFAMNPDDVLTQDYKDLMAVTLKPEDV